MNDFYLSFDGRSKNPFKSSNGRYMVYPEKTLASNDVCIAEDIEKEETVVVKILKNRVLAQRELILERKNLSHPNIIKYIYVDVIFTTTFVYMPKYSFSLQRYMVEKKAWGAGFPNDMALDIFKEMCKPIEFLHQHKIAHRDIKLDNYLVDISSENPKIVLSDFGLSYDWFINREKVDTFEVGSPAYMSPELVSLSEYHVSKPDVWALGVCLYILRYGKFPFWGRSKGDCYCFVRAFKYDIPPTDEDEECFKIIKKIFVKHYDRPSVSELF